MTIGVKEECEVLTNNITDNQVKITLTVKLGIRSENVCY